MGNVNAEITFIIFSVPNDIIYLRSLTVRIMLVGKDSSSVVHLYSPLSKMPMFSKVKPIVGS